MDNFIKQHRQQILELAKRRGAERVRVFGSMAKDQATASSDVDFLVEMRPGSTAFALGGLMMDLQELLGRQVDLATPDSLHPAIRENILREAVEL